MLAFTEALLYCVENPISAIIKPVHKEELTLCNLDPMYLFSHVFKLMDNS